MRVEEGRWARIKRSDRLFQHCESQNIEDSSHFILINIGVKRLVMKGAFCLRN